MYEFSPDADTTMYATYPRLKGLEGVVDTGRVAAISEIQIIKAVCVFDFQSFASPTNRTICYRKGFGGVFYIDDNNGSPMYQQWQHKMSGLPCEER